MARGAMVCAGIVEHDVAAGTYGLPAEHAQLLTRDRDVNMAVVTHFFRCWVASK